MSDRGGVVLLRGFVAKEKDSLTTLYHVQEIEDEALESNKSSSELCKIQQTQAFRAKRWDGEVCCK